MLPDLLGLLTVAVLLAVPFAVRRLRPGRATPPAGPQATPPAGAGARPEPQPRGEVTGPFGYDNGVLTGGSP